MALAKQILRFIEKLRSSETDTSKVLKPDGTGGIEFGDPDPSPAAWGSITGTVSDQTDLQAELDAKENNIPNGTTSQYIRGNKTLATLDKSAVGLDSVDNTSDSDKVISDDTQTALDLKTDDATIHPLGKSGNINDMSVPGGDAIGNSIFRDTVTSWVERLIQLADVVGLTSALGLKADQTSLDTHTNNVSNPHSVTTNQLNLQNVDNTSDADKPVSTAQQTEIDTKQDFSEKGEANGYCELDGAGLVPASRLTITGLNPRGNWDADTNTPTLSDSGGGGVTNDFFIVSVPGSTSLDGISTWTVGDTVLNANNVWNRTPNVQSVASVHGRTGAVASVSGDYDADQIDETASNKILTSTERAAIIASTGHTTSDGSDHSGVNSNTNHRNVVTGNPHVVTKGDLVIENVDNVSDANKPVSTATQTALDLKANESANLDTFNDVIYTSPTNGQMLKRVGGSWQNETLDGSDVGLDQVDNTSDANKPVSIATQTTLDLKANDLDLDAHTTDLGNPHLVEQSDVGLGNVDNTSDLNKPISTDTQTALDLKADDFDLLDHTTATDNPHIVTKTQVGLSNVDNTSDLDKPVSTATGVELADKLEKVGLTTQTVASIVEFLQSISVGDAAFLGEVTINGASIVDAAAVLGVKTKVDGSDDLAVEFLSVANAVQGGVAINAGGIITHHGVNAWVVKVGLATQLSISNSSSTFSGSILGGRTTTNIVIASGSSTEDGANIVLDGGSSANPSRIRLRQGTTNVIDIISGNATFSGTVTAPTFIAEEVDLTPQLSQPTHKEGRMYYNDVEKSIDLYIDIPDVTINMPYEVPVRVHNQTGVTITNGQAVRAQLGVVVGDTITVLLSQADTTTNAVVLGIATHDIENNTDGIVTVFGKVGGLDTSSFAAGAPLFLSASTPGDLVDVEQQILNPVALCLVSDVSEGIIFVRPRGIINVTAIGQVRGTDEVQAITTTPTKCYCFDLSELELNVDVEQTQNPVGGENGYDGVMSPATIGASGFYRFYFNISIDATGNNKHIFELYINGSPTGIVSSIDLSNNQITAGTGSLTGITESILTNSDTIEVFVYTDAGTSTVTYESSLSGIERTGNI